MAASGSIQKIRVDPRKSVVPPAEHRSAHRESPYRNLPFVHTTTAPQLPRWYCCGTEPNPV